MPHQQKNAKFPRKQLVKSKKIQEKKLEKIKFPGKNQGKIKNEFPKNKIINISMKNQKILKIKKTPVKNFKFPRKIFKNVKYKS